MMWFVSLCLCYKTINTTESTLRHETDSPCKAFLEEFENCWSYFKLIKTDVNFRVFRRGQKLAQINVQNKQSSDKFMPKSVLVNLKYNIPYKTDLLKRMPWLMKLHMSGN